MFWVCTLLLICLCVIASWLLCMRCRCRKKEHPLEENVSPLSTLRQATVQAYLKENAILPHLVHVQRDDVIQEMLEHLHSIGALKDVSSATRDILQREAQMSTCIGSAIACPHARTTTVDKLTTIVGISKRPIHFDASENGSCHIVILTLMPPTMNSPYMAFITAMLTLLGSPQRRHQILHATTAVDVRKAFLA